MLFGFISIWLQCLLFYYNVLNDLPKYRILCVPLHKIGGVQQFESKLSLHSLALSLHKIGGVQQFESKISLHSLALSLHKTF
ncbi:hypothetical protein HMPREF0649_00461 [Segatella buccae D17]|nr:hypothetical protein HMPREF0649_00461 [Segatella buccae D17]